MQTRHTIEGIEGKRPLRSGNSPKFGDDRIGHFLPTSRVRSGFSGFPCFGGSERGSSKIRDYAFLAHFFI